MDEGYPRAVAQDFPGIGNKVDAVFQSRGKWTEKYFLRFVTIVREAGEVLAKDLFVLQLHKKW